MYKIQFTSKMKKDVKRMKKRGRDISKLTSVLSILASGAHLPERFHDHQLSGNMSDFRSCHIEPDWLLVYEIQNDVLILMLYRLGTHSELFKK